MRVAALGLAWLLLGDGCGPTGHADEAHSGSTDGGSESGASSTSGDPLPEPPPASCVSSPQVGVDPFASEPDCATYYGAIVEVATVEARIVNRSDRILVLPSRTFGVRATPRHFDISGTVGDRLIDPIGDACSLDPTACAAWSDDPPLPCEAILPAPFPSVVIQPGGWYAEPWEARMTTDVSLPDACYTTDETEVNCSALLGIALGSFEVRAHAAELPADRPQCGCQPDARGSCEARACELETTRTAVASYDGVCDTFEVSFEP